MTNRKEKVGAIQMPLKVLIVIVVIVLAFLIGAMIGFGLLGDGNPFAVFHQNTWEHIFSFFTKGPKT